MPNTEDYNCNYNQMKKAVTKSFVWKIAGDDVISDVSTGIESWRLDSAILIDGNFTYHLIKSIAYRKGR
jgi:hypothetical protein